MRRSLPAQQPAGSADLAAAAFAGAMNAQAFVAVTNVRRVLRDINDPNSAIDTLDAAPFNWPAHTVS